METEVLAIAIVRPLEGRETEVLNVLRDFYAMLSRKGYSRDHLYRSEKDPSRLINLRYWASNEMLREASEDPEVHRYWHTLAEMAEIEKVYEQLRELPVTAVTSR
jgi:Antibiotic biosynthesis monooxygenase